MAAKQAKSNANYTLNKLQKTRPGQILGWSYDVVCEFVCVCVCMCVYVSYNVCANWFLK